MKYIVWLGLVLISSISFATPIKVVATTSHITDLAKNIGGDLIDVTGLMGPGVDPHLYRATQSDVRTLSNADVILYNGLHLEAQMGKVFETMKRNKIVSAVATKVDPVQLLESIDYPGQHDPHIWFDVDLWKLAANQVFHVLIEADPDNFDTYQANMYSYTDQLTALQQETFLKVAELDEDKRVLVTAHDAFRYFGRAYDFEVVGLQGLSTESEAGAKDVIELAEYIVQKKVKAIFVESSVPERNIKAVQEAVKSRGWDVEIGGELFSDAMGDEGTEEETYLGMIRYNVNTIVNALK